MASNRDFAYESEEVVYRCVAVRNEAAVMGNVPFKTEWLWNGDVVRTFNSDEQIGVNNTCGLPANHNLSFLHLTLVSTTNTTCVSLLIVIPSLTPANESYTNWNMSEVGCVASKADTKTNSSSHDNRTLNHYIISGESCIMYFITHTH